MAIINDLIEALLERNKVEFSGAFTIGLRQNGIKVKGEIPAAIIDMQKNKTLANLVVPIEANVEIKEMTFPIPTPR